VTEKVKRMAFEDFQKLMTLYDVYGEDFGKMGFICHEGGVGKHMYLILDGKVTIYKNSPPPKQKRIDIAQMGPGDFFGELSLFEGVNFNATVQALTHVKTLVIDMNVLKEIVMTNPKFAIALIKRFSNRVRNCQSYFGEFLQV